MLELSFALIAIVVVAALMHFPNLRQRVEDVIVGTYYQGLFSAQLTGAVGFVVAVWAVVWGVYCGSLFFLGVALSYMPLMLVALLLVVVPLMIVMYVFMALHAGSKGLAKSLVGLGENYMPTVLVPDKDLNGLEYSLAFMGLTLVNALRSVIMIPWNMVIGTLVSFGTLIQSGSDWLKFIGRALALVNIYLLALMSIGLVQIQFGMTIIDLYSMLLLLLLFSIILAMGVLLDWTIGMKGMPASGTVMATIALFSLILVLSAYWFPTFANGVVMTIANGGNYVGRKANSLGVGTSTSKFPEYVVLEDLRPNTDLFFDDGQGAFKPIHSSSEIFIRKGSVAVTIDPTPKLDTSGPVPMIQLYFPDENDPQKIQVKTRIDRRFWVPAKFVSAVN